MIGKLIKGRGARGLVDYLLDEDDQKGVPRPHARIIGSTFAGRSAREIAAEFGALHALRPRLGVYVAHEALRLPEGDPDLDDETWARIATRWASEMGFEDFLVVSHGDGHVHIAASRIKRDGSVVSDQQDYRRSEAIIRQIEKAFDLTAVESSHLLDKEKYVNHHKAPTRGQIIYSEVSGDVPPAMRIAALIDGIIGNGATVSEMIRDLEDVGVAVHPNIASTGLVSGMAYELDGIRVTSKAMGRGLTWSNLQKRGLSYEPDRDDEAIRSARSRRQVEAAAALEGSGDAGGGGADLPSLRERAGGAGPGDPGQPRADPARQRATASWDDQDDSSDRDRDGAGLHDTDELDRLVHLAAAEAERHRGQSSGADGQPQFVTGREGLAVLERHLTEAIGRAGEEVGRLVRAAGAEKYVIMVRTPDTVTGTVERHQWTAEQVLEPKNMSWLRARNAELGGVYIRPMDRRVTILDDLGVDQIEQLKDMNFAPAIVVETSANNFQAWIRLLPPEAPEPGLDVATQASRSLIKAFGGDAGAVGAERFGRMPGFVNRKPTHDQKGRGPWVTLRAATGALAAAGRNLIQRIEMALQATAERLKAAEVRKHNAKVKKRSFQSARAAPGSGDADALMIVGLQRSMSETDDQSVADFRACGFALKHGAHPEDVAEALLRHSPDIEARHPYTQAYIDRTVRKAGATDYVHGRHQDDVEPEVSPRAHDGLDEPGM
jgi:hypothetical protein